MEFLDLEDVLGIHQAVLQRSGGEPGVLNLGLVEACLDRCRWGPFGHEPDFAHRAAFIVRGIGQDHPFADGNKRTAYEAADTFAQWNGLQVAAAPDDIIPFMLDVAQARLDLHQIGGWVRRHLRKA